MNDRIIDEISKNLKISTKSIMATLNLLMEGNTIPFIARYRKERTDGLDETQIRKISEYYNYEVNLQKRKDEVIRLIDEKGLLTEELVRKINESLKLVEIEDLYRPFKEHKKTLATDAIKNGLEPLAKIILALNESTNISLIAKDYLNENVKNIEDAIKGAKYIIAEMISDNASYRKYIRTNTYLFGKIVCKKKKNKVDELKTYEMYYDYQENIKNIKLYRILALNRGEKEDYINVSIDIDESIIIDYLKDKLITNSSNSSLVDIITDSIIDSYKRLIAPSISREIRSELKNEAEIIAIENFSENLEKLLMQPPMKEKNILGFDPAFRTGCKLAVLNYTGEPLKVDVIYPHEPINDVIGAKKKVIDLIYKYDIDIIAIGNGTASRESADFISDTIKSISDKKVEYIIVNEAGASVYSASKLAISEFPDLQVEQRSAISIGRRLSDPLAELVKIDPESIGVGLYQHDVTAKNLKESLNFVVEKVVNQVGVNINTASSSILKYISGLTKTNIEKILKYRSIHKRINTREELLKNKIISEKTYEQAIGFLRIQNGDNLLDQTSIHPESYKETLELLKYLGIEKEEIGSEKAIEKLNNIDKQEVTKILKIDDFTISDIILSLKKPNRDPRDMIPMPLLKSDVLHLEDLKVGMKLQGTVRNVVDFGAFVDIGLKNDGLVHISKITNRFIKHPSEILSVGDIIDVFVDDIFIDKKKVALTMISNDK